MKVGKHSSKNSGNYDTYKLIVLWLMGHMGTLVSVDPISQWQVWVDSRVDGMIGHVHSAVVMLRDSFGYIDLT